jgi:uncharacterized protein YceK
VSLVCGCNTIANLQERQEVFGGVRYSSVVGCGLLADAAGLTPHEDTYFDRSMYAYIGLAELFDLPFSLVGDTVTLPITIPVSIFRRLDGQPSGPAAEPSEPNGPNPPSR